MSLMYTKYNDAVKYCRVQGQVVCCSWWQS